MKSALPVLLASLLFASCTTAYKSGQTPDDVYYSPARERAEYVNTEERTASQKYRNNDRYDEYADEDRYLRMKVYNRSRWSALDNDWCTYNSYRGRYGNNYYYNNSWNSYAYWNYFYNPYYSNVIVVNPKSPVYSSPRKYNLHVFDDSQTGSNPKGPRTYGNTSNSNRNNDNYRGSGSNAGRYLRDVFSNSSNSSSSSSNSGSSNNNSTRSSSSSSSGSSSSGSSSSGSSAPVRKF
ncbi:MAG TPA: hypothetical protein VGB46_11925 [Flavisolibacter sp.]|jgi:uncharacterized membrane protein YgcG